MALTAAHYRIVFKAAVQAVGLPHTFQPILYDVGELHGTSDYMAISESPWKPEGGQT